ncbi:multipass membrane protein [Candidatus Mancarchaeum acidiphilum]|uniref:Multipass membrane protein n=1 Tax=Candidatus Mancarchaeum acidiphilum TaxID=1920749 RepID=A0A218NNE1_9ARCH|nr:hypothetical protein [Candidatus Mancarchaeum acidiphilum]ASI13997.1 multipass membrane protein [Candidatus Mancarchaeum acidiphilum]
MLGYTIDIYALSIMIAIGGILLGLGYAFNDLNLKRYGKKELLESLVNGIMIGALILAFGQGGVIYNAMESTVTSVSPAIGCGSMSNNYAICFAYNFLINPAYISIDGRSYPSLIDDSLGLLVPLSTIYTILGIIGSMSFSLGVVSITLHSVMAPLLSVGRDIIEILTFANISIYMQAALLKVIGLISLSLLMPIGIVLRSFYFTRRLGGSIIALTIGLFAVLPMMYLLNAVIISNYSTASAGSMATQSLATATAFEGSIFSDIIGNSAAGIGIASFYSSLSGFAKEMNQFFESIVDALAILIIEVVFLPVLSIIMTIISTRELARILGTEISFGRFDVF